MGANRKHEGAFAKTTQKGPTGLFPIMDWEKNKRVLERLQELTHANCDSNEITAFLISLKAISRSGIKSEPLPKGTTMRVLRKFPSRITHIAAEIDCLNEHLLFNPKIWVSQQSSPHHHPRLLRDLTLLPQILRMYASYVERRADVVAGFRKGYGRKQFVELYLIRHLMKYVHQTTGQPHYEALAELLSAAWPEHDIWTADTLRKLDRQDATAQYHPNSPRQ